MKSKLDVMFEKGCPKHGKRKGAILRRELGAWIHKCQCGIETDYPDSKEEESLGHTVEELLAAKDKLEKKIVKINAQIAEIRKC